MQIVKRDGRLVDFDKAKIENAVQRAFIAVDGELSDKAIQKSKNIANYIETKSLEDNGTELDVESIQDLVEKGLMSTKRKDVAKAYIIYRDDRSRERQRKTKLIKSIGEKLRAENVQNQNANVDEYSFGGRMGEASDAMSKQYALDYLLSDMARENHLKNMVYIHDLSHYAIGDHNCMSCPIDELLANGFDTRQVDIRPAQSVSTAFQLLAVIFQLQSLQQFGGVAATHLDHSMVPYVRKSFAKHFRDGLVCFEDIDEEEANNYVYDIEEKEIGKIGALKVSKKEKVKTPKSYIKFNEDQLLLDHKKVYNYAMKMTEKEVYQAVEAMYHNLNSLQSRSGNQLPFSSINYGTCTLEEGRLIIKALLEASIEGVGGLHRTSIFPCGIFQVMEGVNKRPGDPNYDLFRLALKSTAKRLYPNYANIDWSVNSGYDKNDPRTYVSTMGCRTYNGFDINGLGYLKDGRGNICPVTIIMPTLAMEAGKNIEKFMLLLDLKIHEAKDMLIERYEYICSQDPKSAKFMYENNVMAGYIPEEGIISALKHGTLALGQLGLAETLQLLIGCDHTEERGMELAKKIEQLFYDRCKEFKEKYKLNIGVYMTPAENLAYTAMSAFRKKYGIIENVSDKDFFTNSIHVPVWKQVSPFEKIDIEAQLVNYSNAGCITYVEAESSVLNNIDALEKIVVYAMDKDIPYFAINVPNDMCMNCGYTGEFDACPECGSESVQQLRRVTGYLTGNYKTAFNKGKQQEVEMRVKHMKFDN